MKRTIKNLAVILSAFLLLQFVPTKLCLAQETTLNMTQLAPAMRILGRGVIENNSAVLEFSASGIEFNLNCSGDVYANIDEDNTRTSLGVILDDDTDDMQTIFIEPGQNQSVKIASELVEGTHKFKLLHLTEFGHNGGVNSFYRIKINSIIFDGSLGEKPVARKYNIEFYGDSITAGQGNLSTVSLGAGNAATWCEKSSVMATYEAYCCEQLEADMSVCAASGWGIAYSFGAGNSTIDKIWDTCYPIDKRNVKIDYANYSKPDLVVMSLGTNDCSAANTLKTNTEEITSKKMAQMIKNVRGVYGESTKVIWLVGMMSGGGVGGGYLNLQKAFNEAVNDNGFENVWFKAINAGQSGGNYHPSQEQHKAAGTALANYINSKAILSDAPSYDTYETTFSNVGDALSFNMNETVPNGYNYSRIADNCNYYGFYNDFDTSSVLSFSVKGLKTGTYKMTALTSDYATRSKAILYCNGKSFGETDFASQGDVGVHQKDLGRFCVSENGRGNFELRISEKAKTGFLLAKITIEKLSAETDFTYTPKVIDNTLPKLPDLVNEGCVAAVGDNQYSSLEEAISTAESDDTIYVLADIEKSYAAGAYPFKIEKNLSIDLNNHTISVFATRVFLVQGGCSLKLLNGKIVQRNASSQTINSTIESRNASIVLKNVDITINAGIYSCAFLDAENYTGLWTFDGCNVSQGAVTNNSTSASLFYMRKQGSAVYIKNSSFDGSGNALYFVKAYSYQEKLFIYSASVNNFKAFYLGSYPNYYTLSATLPEKTFATLIKGASQEQKCDDFSAAESVWFYCEHCFADGACDRCGYEPIVLRGDLNSDGITDAKDYLLLKKFLAKYDVAAALATADLNNDGIITVLDALKYKKYLVDGGQL